MEFGRAGSAVPNSVCQEFLFPVQSLLGSSLSPLWYSCHITGGGKEQLHTAQNVKAEGGTGGVGDGGGPSFIYALST